MNRSRWLAAAAAGSAVVLVGGAALAANGSRNPRSDFLADVAERAGVSQDKLEDAIEDTSIARIDAAVAAGRITRESGETLKQRVRSGGAPAGLPGFRGRDLGRGPLGGGMFGPGYFAGADLSEMAAGYLGMDEADVRAALADGKSLAELAKDKGKSVDGLKQALRDAVRKKADQAVEDGVLKKGQADRRVEWFGSAVDELVARKPGGGFDFRRAGGTTEPHFGFGTE